MFRDRVDAGRRLAQRVCELDLDDPITLGLPRGGVVVAAEVAEAVRSPLDVLIVQKLGMPFEPEIAMGAIGEDSVEFLDWAAIEAAGVTDLEVAGVIRRGRAELERRSIHYRGMRPPMSLVGRTALIVDDGIATGSTARTACLIARAHAARHAWWSRFRWPPPTPSNGWSRTVTTSSACGLPRTSLRSASTTDRSTRCPTTRSRLC